METITSAFAPLIDQPKLLVALALAALVALRAAPHLTPLLARLARAEMPRLTDKDLGQRFEITLRDSDPEIALIAEIEDDLEDLLEAGRWDLFHSLLAAWERDRAETPFGTMFHRIGAEVALRPLLDIADAEVATGIRASGDLLDRAVGEFAARMAAFPGDHIAAVLAARAHIAAGWAARGDGWITNVSEEDLLRMAQHYDAAEGILAPFAGCGSSLVAEARYFVCLGLEDGGRLLRGRFEDWLTVDPDDLRPWQVHGFNLLPRWFGTLDEVEAEARRAAEATAPRRGAAGYAIFHGSILGCGTDETRARIDPAFFVRSALDRARTAGSQWGVNRMAEFLLQAMLESRGETREIYRNGLRRLVEDHLRVLVPSAWTRPAADVRRDLARAFRAELEGGGRVRVGARGIEILPPETAPEAAATA